ncbi:MAG: phosphoribosylformylglycinamidine synthase [Bdellovibrio sp.]|nr:phosphoribosylformylglycinamidine synthase [Bdellovibrio sp.]
MFIRVEVAVRPEYSDSAAQGLLRRIELINGDLRKKIRWARLLDVFWLDMPGTREELIPAISKVCWDRVLQWMFTGNLMPSAAGKTGGLQDLMEHAPNRPGKFWGIERRFRPGVTDNVGKTLLEAFEIVLGRSMPDARAGSGSLFMLEGTDLDEDSLAVIAKQVLCNELIETWTMVNEESLKKNERFHQERVRFDLPKMNLRVPVAGLGRLETYDLTDFSDSALEELSKKKLWALSLAEMKAIRKHFSNPEEIERRRAHGLGAPTDVELEVIAQTWSEHCKHKIFNAKINYSEEGAGVASKNQNTIPAVVDGLFRTTIAGATAEIARPWLLSVFEDNAGICALDEEDAFCIKVETHNSPSALDPYGGALTGIVGVNRDILGCGLGAKPIFNTDVFCLAVPDYSSQLPEKLLHPRRILEGVRRGVEHGGNKSGIPTVNGALVFDDRYLGKPLVYCGTGGIMPRKSAGQLCQAKVVESGDRICMVGGRIGKDGIHGATFSSLALDESSPMSAVQLGDPLTQKRASDFLLEARDKGLYRAITDNGAGGLSSSVGEMARLSGGALMDISKAKTKYPGLKPYELVVSESQERMTLAVPKEKVREFTAFAERRGVEVSDLGEFTAAGRFQIQYEGTWVADLDLEFLHRGVPRLELNAVWRGVPDVGSVQGQTPDRGRETFTAHSGAVLLRLLSRPNIASKEWMIRQYDHEVQGTSVVKPLHTIAPGTPQACSGPNDAGVIKPKPQSDQGLVVGCGINPKLSDWDCYLMAQSAVDEAVRNVLCVGAEYGKPESVLALVDNFCWPDPVGDSAKSADLVRACYGLRDAALALALPIVSGKDSMKNDFKGMKNGEAVKISVPPTLLMTAVGRVPDVRQSRTADFKGAGDLVFLLGPGHFGLQGSELGTLAGGKDSALRANRFRVAEPDWNLAQKIYSWLGGATGRFHGLLKSLHDVSEGGLLVAVAESLLARGLGASLTAPAECEYWEFFFGEGFHSFVASVSEADAPAVLTEWKDLGIPFYQLGTVELGDRLEVCHRSKTDTQPSKQVLMNVPLQNLRSAWKKEGYWE